MRPILCFDIESTGTDPAIDRIVSLAYKGESFQGEYVFNPGVPIPKEASDVHGFTEEDVRDKPTFTSCAAEIHGIFKDCDLLGFNLSNFDIPILWEEFYRARINWDLSDTLVLDAGTLYKKREQRTLSAAVELYCGRTHEDSHEAMPDVDATLDVWAAQLVKYGLEGADRAKLADESSFDEVRVDLAGKIIIGKDGRPAYNIGKAKGTAVEDDPGFGRWMLDKDFSENTKQHVRQILRDTYQKPVEALDLFAD